MAQGTSENPIIKGICGRRHQTYWVTMSGQTHGCRYCAAIETERELNSAKGIARRAAEFREEAGFRLAAAANATPGGARQARHLAEAAKAFQAAYELEN